MTSSAKPGSRRKLAALLAVTCVAACDCDERLRKALSNDGPDRRMSDQPTRPDGPAEAEPNNEPANASPIRIAQELREVRGEIGLPGDVDWFALTAASDESLEVIVTPESMLDVALELRLPDGAPSVYDNGRRGDPEVIPVLKAGPDKQRFAVRAVGSSTGSYTVSFKRRIADSALESEPNDEAAVATVFNVPGQIEGFFDRPDDRDVYALRGTPGAPFELELGPVPGIRQIATIFADSALSQPRLTIQIPEEMPARIPNLALGADAESYLVISPLGGASRERSYTLRATPHPPLGSGVLELEPNDNKPMALVVDGTGHDVVVRGYLHSADDVDRFQLTAAPRPATPPGRPVEQAEAAASPAALAPFLAKRKLTAPIAATLEWTDPNATFGLQWKTADGLEADFRRDSPEPKVTACGMSLDAGPGAMAVRVERLTTAPKLGEPQYSLTINDLSAAAAWEAEPNQTPGQADALIDSRRGTLGQYEDVDVFAFAVEAEPDATRTIKLSAAARATDVIMRIVDDGGGIVANVDNAAVGSGESTTLDLPPGLYFVELRWKGGALCEPYALELVAR